MTPPRAVEPTPTKGIVNPKPDPDRPPHKPPSSRLSGNAADREAAHEQLENIAAPGD